MVAGEPCSPLSNHLKVKLIQSNFTLKLLGGGADAPPPAHEAQAKPRFAVSAEWNVSKAKCSGT
jgi:hypothetical protein